MFELNRRAQLGLGHPVLKGLRSHRFASEKVYESAVDQKCEDITHYSTYDDPVPRKSKPVGGDFATGAPSQLTVGVSSLSFELSEKTADDAAATTAGLEHRLSRLFINLIDDGSSEVDE